MIVGAFCGKFLPPHIGHIRAIKWSKEKCDKLIVVIAENPQRCKELCLQSGFPVISADLRIKRLKEALKDTEGIEFVYLDETGLKQFPEGQKEWAERFKKVVGNVDYKFADETYRELNQNYFPECKFIPFDREIPISATLIRHNLKKYFDFLVEPSKAFFKEYL